MGNIKIKWIDLPLMSDIVLLWLMSATRKDVDYLPMAKPDAINHLEIRRDCVHLLGASGCW
jgi:hypothetical protein